MRRHREIEECDTHSHRKARGRRRPSWGPVRHDEEIGAYVLTAHATQRAAQRNLSQDDIRYVLRYGRAHHCANAVIYFLGRRDIPTEDLPIATLARLEGTLVLAARHDPDIITVYRNRNGLRVIRKKFKHLRRRLV